MKKINLILVLILVMVTGIGIVSAETVTGSLGNGDEGWQSNNYGTSAATVVFNTYVDSVYFEQFQYSTNLQSIIFFSNKTSSNNAIFDFTNDTIISGSSPFNATISGVNVGYGTMGYYRVFNTATPPVEQSNFVWLQFDWWNPGDYTGAQTIALAYNNTEAGMNGARIPMHTSVTHYGTPGACHAYMYEWVSSNWYISTGDVTLNRDLRFLNEYTAVKPSGLGITGNITKNLDEVYYSQVFIINPDTGNAIASDYTLNGNDFSFNVPLQQIQISILSSGLEWYNTSTLFSPGYGTPTPTPTTTPVTPDNPIPAGYIRSMAQCVDGQSSATIHDCQLDLYDVENTSWSNGSYDGGGSYYGTWWIDTLPGHTINAYGSAAGYTSVSRLSLPASSSKMYELIMWPTTIPAAAAGSVNLFVLVHDADSGNAITGAGVQVRIPSGYTYAGTTGTSGSKMFIVPNASVITATATKYGYITGSRTITTSDSGDDTVRIELLHQVVTTAPTATIPPGGVTTAVTMDTRTAGEKDLAMMDKIRTAGPGLIDLAIVATVMGLLGLIMKSWK